MSFRQFELCDLLCEALIFLEAGDPAAAAERVGQALAWVEADWLATPTDLPASVTRVPSHYFESDDDDG